MRSVAGGREQPRGPLGLDWASGPEMAGPANHWEAGRAQGTGWAMSLQVHPGPTAINLVGLPATWGLSLCSSGGRWESDRVTCS